MGYFPRLWLLTPLKVCIFIHCITCTACNKPPDRSRNYFKMEIFHQIFIIKYSHVLLSLSVQTDSMEDMRNHLNLSGARRQSYVMLWLMPHGSQCPTAQTALGNIRHRCNWNQGLWTDVLLCTWSAIEGFQFGRPITELVLLYFIKVCMCVCVGGGGQNREHIRT